jgi:hypothetical protein
MSWQLTATVITGIVSLTAMLCAGLLADAWKHTHGGDK